MISFGRTDTLKRTIAEQDKELRRLSWERDWRRKYYELESRVQSWSLRLREIEEDTKVVLDDMPTLGIDFDQSMMELIEST